MADVVVNIRGNASDLQQALNDVNQRSGGTQGGGGGTPGGMGDTAFNQRMVEDIRREMQRRGVVMVPGSASMSQIINQYGQSLRQNTRQNIHAEYEQQRVANANERDQRLADVERRRKEWLKTRHIAEDETSLLYANMYPDYRSFKSQKKQIYEDYEAANATLSEENEQQELQQADERLTKAIEELTKHFEDEAKITAEQLVAAEDRELFISSMKPEAILRKLEEKQNADLVIRLLMADGSVKHASVRVSPISEEGYDVVIGVRDIEEQIQNRENSERMERERVSFRRMSALAGNYLAIYTVDPVTDHFSRYSAAEEFADLLSESEGEKFFEQSQRNAVRVICPEDLPLFRKEFTKENVLKEIDKDGDFILPYRLMIEDGLKYVRMRAVSVEEKGGSLLLIGISDIDATVRREAEYTRQIEESNKIATRDALTGVKNKYAYQLALEDLERKLAMKECDAFAIGMFDTNDLKVTNDTLGHAAGDAYLRKACSLICDVFTHSPVFRIGGDEFAAILTGHDYENLETLREEMKARMEYSELTGIPMLACGYASGTGADSAQKVFEAADADMYEEKRRIKEAFGSEAR